MNEKKLILIIDDDQSIRKGFRLTLENAGYTVETCDNGADGIKQANDNNYQLILLDLNMPGINGVEVLRAIRQQNKDVPIFIITAFQQDYLQDLKDVAAEKIDFNLLNKPIASKQLIAAVSSVFEGTVTLQPTEDKT